jgi:hypothetical protein
MRRLLLLLSALCLLGALVPAGALADHSQVSVFQDDAYLIDSPESTVISTLDVLRLLGAQVIRVNMQWDTLAPDPLSRTEPKGFDATDPAAYPAADWAPYDQLVHLAPLFGMSVEFNLTAPGPLWAMGKHPPTTRAANHWYPNARQFFDFVYAVGEHFNENSPYDEPSVTDWSIWNEPDQPGWLAPQSIKVKGREVAESPRLYRALADAAYYGLYFSGHGKDKILLGETAPEGDETGGVYTPLTPLPWLRDVYCVNSHLRPLSGTAAKNLGCPQRDTPKQFVAANSGLFSITGFAHHPYYFFHPPNYRSPDPNFIPLGDITRLENFLDGTFRAYGSKRKLPIYFTEYGYQTRPPDPYQTVSLNEQAAYLNEADYISWSNARVKSVAQFLLYDAAPNALYTSTQFDYWDTFQTGLLFQSGKPKPSFYAYLMPIWIPQPKARLGTSTFIWGQVRPADRLGAQKVTVEWRPTDGKYQTIGTTMTTAGTGYLTTHVKLPGTGYIKLAWKLGKATTHSRAVPVTVS